MDKLTKFNVNHYVRVKLKPHGHGLLEAQHKELFGCMHDYRRPEEDSEGWSRWQLWSLMSQLGAHCGLGFASPFETGILIETSDQ